MPLLSPTVEYLLIIIGISSGAIAVSVLMNWLFCIRRAKTQQISNVPAKNLGVHDDQEVPHTASGETEETNSPSPSRHTSPDRNGIVSEIPASSSSLDEGDAFPAIDYMFKQNPSLLDFVVEEEDEEDEEDSVSEDSDSGKKDIEDESATTSISIAAKLAAAWKLRAWAKERDSLSVVPAIPPRQERPTVVNTRERQIVLFPTVGGAQILCGQACTTSRIEPLEMPMMEV